MTKPGLFAAMHAQGLSLAQGFDEANARPNHYQDLLQDFLSKVRPDVIVETGSATGISTDRILTALDKNERGILHSIDPEPCAVLFDIEHRRWRAHRAFSQDLLEHIYQATGTWDVFLHDSDHGVWCQTFEYEVAWHFVRAGGYILSDDTTWGSPAHHAWKKFCERHDVTPNKLGNCGVVMKPPPDAPKLSTEGISYVMQAARNLADTAYRAYCQIPGATDQPSGGVGNGASKTHPGAKL